MMEKKFALLVSALLHPMLMPLFTVIMLFNSGTYIAYSVNDELKNWIYTLVCLNMILVPTFIFLMLKRKGIIKSLHMETAEERKLPFVVSLVFYMLTYYLMRELNLPGLLYILILGSAISIILAFFISLWWKISIHMLGVGGLVGAILGLTLRLDADLINILSIAILGAGLIGYARLKLYAHTPAQVYAGFLLGSGLMLGLIMGA